jgi:hypothetical protein
MLGVDDRKKFLTSLPKFLPMADIKFQQSLWQRLSRHGLALISAH